jgi:hypothetical protein
MLLDYARTSTPQCKCVLAVMAAAVGVLCAAVAFWCAFHVMHVSAELRRATGCGTCNQEMVAGIGLPLYPTLSLGVFSGGCALVAGIQSIRFANRAREWADAGAT